MRTSWVLDLAADVIERRGWTMGDWGYHDEGGPVCLEGGIIAALGLGLEDLRGEGWMAFETCPAYRAVQDYLGIEPGGRMTSTLWYWNDRTERTEAEVIAALRGAAAAERVKEEKENTVSV